MSLGATGWLGFLLCFFALTPAAAQPIPGFEDEASAIVEPTLDVYDSKCRISAFYVASQTDLLSCRGNDPETWRRAAEKAMAFQQAAASYYVVLERTAPEPCESGKGLDPVLAGELAKKPELEAQLAAARAGLAAALSAAADAKAEPVMQAQQKLDGLVQQAKLVDEAIARRRKELRPTVLARLEGALAELNTAIGAAERDRGDADDFEKVAREEPEQLANGRAAACARVRERRLLAFSGRDKNQEKSLIDDATQTAHDTDTLRKTSSASTVATLGSSTAEQPGAPDYIVYSILSGLGAEQATTGTQLALTVNLSSLIWPTRKARLAQDVGYRNLLLRGAFPANATSAETPAPASDDAGSSDTVRRFSLVLGGSFVDESDTRLPANRACYELALAYAPIGPTLEQEQSSAHERAAYFDVCHRLAVNKQRLSWRAGLGFLTRQEAEATTTRPEMLAGVVIWGPTSQLYANLIYQRYLRPRGIHVAGLGLSVAGNAGGASSGVDAWARFGMDVTFFVGHEPDARETGWELRLTPVLRGKLFGDGVASVALGPRISAKGDPTLLASVSFGYDADRIINQLLTPLPSP